MTQRGDLGRQDTEPTAADLHRELDAALAPFVWSQGDVDAVIAAVEPFVAAAREEGRQDGYDDGLQAGRGDLEHWQDRCREEGRQEVHAALDRLIATAPRVTFDNGYPVRAVPVAELLSLRAAVAPGQPADGVR